MRFLLILFLLLSTITSAFAADEAERLVSDSYFAAKDLLNPKKFDKTPSWLKNSKAVIIIPSLYKGGLIVGGSGGSGIIMAKAADGSWSYPAFVDIGGGSIGLQIGASVSEAMIFIQSSESLARILDGHFRFGADAGIAVATIGAGLSGSTDVSSKTDFIVMAKSSGLYAGLSLEGSTIRNRSDLVGQFYGHPDPVHEVIMNNKNSNPKADELRQFLTSITRK